MKTAVTVLQEMMVKIGQTPEYECVSQLGPKHSAMFEYRCTACGLLVSAFARSKKEAKQEAARLMLHKLAARGDTVPHPYNAQAPTKMQTSICPNGEPPRPSPGASPAAHSYVALLKDLCEEYRLPGCEYELVGDTGPPHMRLFTIRVRIGSHERFATSTTKKAARQLAAEKLYLYLRENLARVTKDFDEEEAAVRAHERAMERYVELREDVCRRPDLGQRISDYHLGLKSHIESEKCELARNVLRSLDDTGLRTASTPALEAALAAATGALGLAMSDSSLPKESGALAVLELTPTSPPLTFAGADGRRACIAVLRYLRLALQ